MQKNVEYIKVKCTLKDRLLFLFTALIKKDLINNNTSQNIHKYKHKGLVNSEGILDNNNKNKSGIDKYNKDNILDIPDKLDIPFFELDNSKIESNL